MANMLCLDFDDTVVLKDIAAQVLERFAPPSWMDLRLRRRSGELSLEQSWSSRSRWQNHAKG
jgi:2-hydroxy-3-keto-5-methylthiopentenyl-1-phosphate phosphatase